MTPEYEDGPIDRRVSKLEYKMERIFTDLYHETGGLVGNFRDLVTILKERDKTEKEKKDEVVEKKKINISQNQVIIGLLSLILAAMVAVTGWLISMKVNHSLLFGERQEIYANYHAQSAEK